ncbi:PIN domain-like protein [Lentinus tigrinus ALCF2SS1-6]|uniref:PIN domain-like protein n=1 Tax=Lentinus tigrinus ALCF2SS1-6 TaxID=1328759 RepID=A0A5C2SDM0_9APHY|nr:PIN domain-like protein [Lentinus tigrinus ALCF2SS1-6]
MGVHGLTPFLQKTCPEVLKQLPERLSAFSGKRIVIDGTLITQRFHFAPMPQRHRHVLAWYRLASHLRNNNIQAVCVFDGRERSLAKEREIERRRKDRKLTMARGEFEAERLDRLQRLTSLLRTWDSVETDEGKKEFATLKQSVENWKLPSGLTSGLATAKDVVAAGASAVVGVPVTLACMAVRGAGKPLEPSSPPSQTITYDSAGELEAVSSLEDITNNTPSPTVVDSEHTEDRVASVTQLYDGYRRSIPQLESISLASSADTSLPVVPASAVAEDELEAAKADYALSKSQHGLLREEATLWTELAESVRADKVPESVTHLAQALETKSSVLSESYMRRTHPPTTETYEESKAILKAMGIPCVQPSGPYEAEALAASLVLHGHADYVASEDTDVLIYGAPLLRNLASKDGPLVLISGAEVRTVLQLDPARFIDFALLLGTDFSQRIKNIGPTRALKYIRQHGSIEHILEHEKYAAHVVQELYLEQVELARDVFQTLPPLPDLSLLEQGEVDEDAVCDILDRYGLRRFGADEWDYSQALSGNYFADNPSAT